MNSAHAFLMYLVLDSLCESLTIWRGILQAKGVKRQDQVLTGDGVTEAEQRPVFFGNGEIQEHVFEV